MSQPFPERPATFGAGEVVLAGVLNSPTSGGILEGLGVVLVPGGLTRRVGLHRLYVEAARRLSSKGARVLRFDLPGVGESGGELRWVTADGLASLEARHVPEIRAALDFLEQESPHAGLVLLGHCSGARSAVVAATEDPRVRGVAAWAMPLGSDDDPAPTPWLTEAVGRLGERSMPVLWAFGTRDPAWVGFRAYLESSALPGVRDRWTVRTVASANHDFTAVAWTREVIDATVQWMLEARARMVTQGEEHGLRSDG